MKKHISVCLFLTSTMSLAIGDMSTLRNHVPEFSETETFLEGEDVKTFRMVDINGDEQADLLWKTSDGDIKYQIHVPKKVRVGKALHASSRFFPTETMVSGENIKTFRLEDVNNDGKFDIVWKNDEGVLKYKLQTETTKLAENYTSFLGEIENTPYAALVNTKWNISYFDGEEAVMSFFNIVKAIEGGERTRHFFGHIESKYISGNIGLTYWDNKKNLVICRRYSGRSDCARKYVVEEII